MTDYTRPKGVMGGPCSHFGLSQPEHVGLSCEQAKRLRSAKLDAAAAVMDKNATINTVKGHLETMIASSEVYVEGEEEIVVGYKIKTGALHKLIGFLGLSIPARLPVVGSQASDFS